MIVGAFAADAAIADASGWSVQKLPDGLAGLLNDVSCTSGNACTAVGAPTLRWDGFKWTAQSGATGAGGFDAVSCPTLTTCIAVGTFEDPVVGPQPVAQGWDGTGWSIQAIPKTADSGLDGVSCTSSSACVAVGERAGRALIERWDGRRWTIQAVPRSANEGLDAVSCRSRRACIAVGGGISGRALIVRWTGNHWTTQRFPGGTNSYLSGISCTPGRASLAVGGHTAGPPGAERSVPLAERSDGSRWSIVGPPHSSMQGGLAAVSCSSSTVCTAVGAAGDPFGPSAPLAERWEGGRWSIQQPARGAHAAETTPGSALNGVSCASRDTCTAVGFGFTSDHKPLIERWHGPRSH